MTPEQFALVAGALAGLLVAITGVLAQLVSLNRRVDGRLSELLALTRKSSLAEGKETQRLNPPADC